MNTKNSGSLGRNERARYRSATGRRTSRKGGGITLVRSVLVVVAMLTMNGCAAEPVEPRTDLGRFDLERVDGHPLPSVLFDDSVRLEEGSFHVIIEVTGGYLVLMDDGRYEHRLSLLQRIDHADGNPAPINWTDHGRLARTGQLIRFDSEWIEGVAFDGQQDASGISVTQDVLQYMHDEGRVTQFRFSR